MQGKWNDVLNYFPIWKTVTIPLIETSRFGICVPKGSKEPLVTIEVPVQRQKDSWYLAMKKVQDDMIDYINQQGFKDGYGLRTLLHTIPTITLGCTPFTKMFDSDGHSITTPQCTSLGSYTVNITATCTGVWAERSIYEVHWDIMELQIVEVAFDGPHALCMPYRCNSNRVHECAHLLQCRWRFILYKRRHQAARKIQCKWRSVSNSPYTTIGRRCILQRYHDLSATQQ